jgi:uncharacterized membrane protein
MAKEIKAKRIYKLKEITYNKENSRNSMLACIPILSIYFSFFEKEDLFVKYHAILYTIVTLLLLCPIGIVYLCGVMLVIYGLLQVSKGKVVKVPGLSQLVLKIMALI